MDTEHREVPLFDTPMAYLVWRRPKSDETAFHRAGLLLARGLGYASQEALTIDGVVERLTREASDLRAEDIERAFRGLCLDLRARDGLI
jgi:hypothetical protein